MSYLGENNIFSFRDNFCESLPEITVSTSLLAEFGRNIASQFSRVAVACADEKHIHRLYALISGISESGTEVFSAEHTDLPSFRYCYPQSACEAGIFISGTKTLKLTFFGNYGFPLGSKDMTKIMKGSAASNNGKIGKLNHFSSMRSIYVNSIRDNVSLPECTINAGISCGNRYIRELWHEFFSDKNDELIFQVSDDGQHVNAYSTQLGFISYDRLKLAYTLMLWERGQAVYLPDNFHYAASEAAAECGYELRKFNLDSDIPKDVSKQRFLRDMLFMCVSLCSDIDRFYALMKRIPDFTTAKREIPADSKLNSLIGKSIIERGGKITLTQSGKNRILLLAQANNAETAAELCADWEKKLRKISSCNNLFHPQV